MIKTKFKLPVSLRPPPLVELEYSPEIQGVTQSLIKMWRDCEVKARMYLAGYVRTSNKGKAAIHGSVTHYGLEFFTQKIKDGEITSPDEIEGYSRSKLITIFREAFASEYVKMDDRSRQESEIAYGIAAVLVPIYFAYWRKDFNEEKKTWIELERRGKVVNKETKIPVRIKRDGLYRGTDSRLWLFETKTKEKWNEEYIGAMAARAYQNLLYLVTVWDEYKELPAGVLFNIVRRPLLKRGAKETISAFLDRVEADIKARPNFYFVRYEAPVSKAALEEFRKRHTLELIKFKNWWIQPKEWDIENTDQCLSFNSPCPYMEYCNSRRKNLTGLEIRKDTHDKYETLVLEDMA